MLLTANPSYLTAAQFKAQPNDQDLTSYTDAQLQDILNRATGKANAILKRGPEGLLAKEFTERYIGDGTNKLELNKNPILYVKRVQIVVPGTIGLHIPIDELLFDFKSGGVLEYTPMLWNATGYFAQFPKGVPVDVTMATGYGWSYSAPAYTTSDIGPGLPAGTYNVALTTGTMYGETSATIRQVTTTGNISAAITPALGAYVYRAYVSSATNNTTLTAPSIVGATSFAVTSAGTIAPGDVLLFGANTANAEYLTVASASGTTVTTTAGALNAHSSAAAVLPRLTLSNISPYTAYSGQALAVTISSLTPQQGLWADAFPLTDSASPQIPQAIIEATRLLALSIIWEQNNPSNRGIALEVSGQKRRAYKATEGTSGRGVPLAQEEAYAYLKPYAFSALL